jgi:hypothetical protein
MYRSMFNLPRDIVIEHRTEKGKEEVRLQLPWERQYHVDDMVANYDN